MRKVATILIIFSTMHSNTEKIDINYLLRPIEK